MSRKKLDLTKYEHPMNNSLWGSLLTSRCFSRKICNGLPPGEAISSSTRPKSLGDFSNSFQKHPYGYQVANDSFMCGPNGTTRSKLVRSAHRSSFYLKTFEMASDIIDKLIPSLRFSIQAVCMTRKNCVKCKTRKSSCIFQYLKLQNYPYPVLSYLIFV
ncbi:hypothetical protein TNCV_3274211 [Trichonephila clavipes]|nr:hypothetical protein TNCV_3274211 [Trichonephila clavipes]